MRKAFLSNIIYLIFINLLVKPFYIFGIDRTIQLRVTEDIGEGTYGLYFALLNFSALFYIVIDLGFTDYNKRMIAREPEKLKEYLPNFLLSKLALSLIYFILVFAIAFGVGYRGSELMMLWPLALNQVLISLIFYFRSNLSGLFYFKWEGFFSVLDRLLMIGICGFLLWGSQIERFEITYFIYAQNIAYGLTALGSGLIVLNAAGFPKFSIDINKIKQIILESLPYAALVFMMTIYSRVDSIMIERMLPNGSAEADIYAKGFRMLDAAQAFSLLFAVLLLPIFARMLRDKSPLDDLVKISFQTNLLFSLTVAVACFFFREEFMTLLYNDGSHYTALIFAVLMFNFVAISMLYIFGTLLTANSNLRELNKIAFVALIMNITLNVILIQYYQALGAAIATAITQFTVAIANLVLAVRIFKLRLETAFWSRQLLFLAVLIGVFFGLSLLGLNWMISLGIGLLLTLVLALLFRVIDIKEWVKIIGSKEEINADVS